MIPVDITDHNDKLTNWLEGIENRVGVEEGRCDGSKKEPVKF